MFLAVSMCSNAENHKKDSNFVYMPFRLEKFTAKILASQAVQLDFVVAENFSVITGYQILVSTDNIQFTVLANITKTSNAPISIAYQWIDETAKNRSEKKLYYKLRQVNNQMLICGESAVLLVNKKTVKEVSVKLAQTNSNTLRIWLNGNVSDGNYITTIRSMSGAPVMVQNATMHKTSSLLCEITGIARLQNGYYVITVQNNDVITETVMFLKQ
jgi:hypothetical protein